MKSFVAYSSDSDFPLENIPFGVFSTKESSTPRVCSRIGDYVIDLVKLSPLFEGPHLKEHAKSVFAQNSLNKFMSLGNSSWKEARLTIQSVFSKGSAKQEEAERCLVPVSKAIMHMPAEIGDYTDFYASMEHASNVGALFRGRENALMPNWIHLPVGYHGRASSVVVSGTDIKRPSGQRNAAGKGDSPKVVFGPSVKMDYELEMAFLIGVGNDLGTPVNVDDFENHVFGAVLMNDWSARDIQAWEYVPLGPFLGKNFGTSISPWVVTLEALKPFRTKGPEKVAEILPYLSHKSMDTTSYDINLNVQLKENSSSDWTTLTTTNYKYLYWSIGQMVAHHTVNGCNLRTGDLLASGTISGPSEDSFGSLLELTYNGTKKFKTAGGSERAFVEDYDEIKITGFAQGNGYRVGFGECSGKILP